MRRFLLGFWCVLTLLMPALAFAQVGTCHEPCREPGSYCDGGLVCSGGTCEGAGGADCGTRGNPGIEDPFGDIPGATINANRERNGIFLLERIGDVRVIPTQNNEGLGVFRYYFDLLYPWLLGMGGGVALLNAVWGGFKIIQAGGAQDQVSEGKNKLLLSVAGLLIILFSATILHTVNPIFFR